MILRRPGNARCGEQGLLTRRSRTLSILRERGIKKNGPDKGPFEKRTIFKSMDGLPKHAAENHLISGGD